VDAVAVIHDPGVETCEPRQRHQCRAGEVEDARKQRHAGYFGEDENSAADNPVSAGDGVQAEQLGRDQDGAGQQKGEERPARAQSGDVSLDGVDYAHRTEPRHESRSPVPDEFLDQEDGGGQPYEGGEQQALKFLQGRFHVVWTRGWILTILFGSGAALSAHNARQTKAF